MTNREQAQQILEHLSTALLCEPITLNEDNTALVGLDNDLGAMIYLIDEATGALLVSVVAGRVEEDDAELLYDLLCANYMWNASGSGTIGIDQANGLVTISRIMEFPLDPADFEDNFAALVGAARYWRTRIVKEPLSTTESTAAGMIRV